MAQPNGNGHARQSPDESWPLVLIADDADGDLRYTAGLLARNGFRVELAGSYEEALAKLRSRRIDAIVADYWFADRTAETGEQLLHEARAIQPRCLRVLFTADPIGLEAAERVGGKWFDKELTASGLVALLHSATKRAGMI